MGFVKFIERTKIRFQRKLFFQEFINYNAALNQEEMYMMKTAERK